MVFYFVSGQTKVTLMEGEREENWSLLHLKSVAPSMGLGASRTILDTSIIIATDWGRVCTDWLQNTNNVKLLHLDSNRPTKSCVLWRKETPERPAHENNAQYLLQFTTKWLRHLHKMENYFGEQHSLHPLPIDGLFLVSYRELKHWHNTA